MTTRTSRLDWLIFLALGFFWGSSYLFIKIGVDNGLQPFTLIMFRLLIGFVLLASVVLLMGPSRIYMGEHWPSDVIGAYCLAACGSPARSNSWSR